MSATPKSNQRGERRMLITHFERERSTGAHSIERLFGSLRPALYPIAEVNVVPCPTPEHTPLWFLSGIWRAFRRRGRVNHIVGDVHYVALGLPGRRTVLTVHDTNRLDQLAGLKRWLYSGLYFQWPLRRSCAVTAISEKTRKRLVELFPFIAEKVCVIPDCLPEGFEPRPKHFNTTRPRILHIGTSPHKNLDRIAEALHGRACTLHIIGSLSGAQRRTLSNFGIDYENAVDISDAEVAEAYADADVVTFPSLSEGFGLPIIEAQATGRALLTSDIPPMRDVAGAGACLVNPYSVSDIRGGLSKVIEDEKYRRRLIEAGFENVKRFAPSVIAAQYVNVYSKVWNSQ